MKRTLWLLAGVALAAACSDTASAPTATPNLAQDPTDIHGTPEPEPVGAHVHHIRGYAGSGRTSRALMLYHDGDIMPSSRTAAIFWGSKWSTDASFAGDKIPGLEAFLKGFGGSNYAHASTEYYGPAGVFVGTQSTFNKSVIDPSAAPSSAPSVSAVQAEVCSQVNAGNLPLASDYVYMVYATTRRGNAGYCAWHSYGSCNGTPIQFAWYFDLDGDSGCNPGTPYGSYTNNHANSQGLAALANVTAHELSEAITDPRNGGWYDRQNGENADKCAWSFSPNNNGLVTLTGGATFKLQMEWSNDAFNSNSGYPNNSGQRACLDGVVKY